MIENKEALSVAVLDAGPALFGRAIMVQGGMPAGLVHMRAARPQRRTGTSLFCRDPGIHRCCGQLCGQLGL